ncbi:hypothetical protein JCM8208_000423 [Rhodotorula glutinis]
MTANYTGGGLVGHRKAKQRVRQDITGTPVYTAAAKKAYQARPGPLLANHSAAHLLGGRRKGQPLASPTFDFAYLRNKQHEGEMWTAPMTSEARRAGGGSRWAGGESSWSTTAAAATNGASRPSFAPIAVTQTSAHDVIRAAAAGSTFLRQQLLANPDWVGLHSIPRPQPSFLPSSRPSAPLSTRPRLPSPRPDPHDWYRRPEVAPTILRGSSVLHGDDDVSSAGLAHLPRSTPPSFLLSQSTSLDAASADADSPVDPRAARPHDSPPPRQQQTPFAFHHDDIAYPIDERETQQQQPQHRQDDEHEMLSFASSTHDPAFGPQLSAHAYAAKYTALDDDTEHAVAPAPRPSPTLAPSTAPSPAPSHDRAQPYHHLSHLHDPSTLHLPDVLDLSLLDLDDDGVLIVHERMGLGCVGLSRAQAHELVERELALRAVGVEAVPEWVWGDGEASEDEWWKEEGEGGTSGVSEEEVSPMEPPAAAASVVDLAPASLIAVASTSLDRPAITVDVLDSAYLDSAPARALGRWRRTTVGDTTGTLFAEDDLSGVMEL